KRSRAIQHDRQLRRRRPDTPPEAPIDELVAQLKRGEAFAPKPQASGALEAQPPLAPFQPPKDLSYFVGREQAMAAVRTALSASNGVSLYCLAGMGGIGKTSLAVHIAHVLREQFADGVLWARLSTSEPLAVLDSWARAYRH